MIDLVVEDPSRRTQGQRLTGVLSALLGLVIFALPLIAAPNAVAFTIVDASYELFAQAELTSTFYREDCPVTGDEPCVTDTSSTTSTSTLTDTQQGAALGDLDEYVQLLNDGVTGTPRGEAFAFLESSVGPSLVTFSNWLASSEGMDADSDAWTYVDEMGNTRRGFLSNTDTYRMSYSSGRLDILLEVDEVTEYALRLGREERFPGSLNQVAYARLNPLDGTGALLPAIFDEEVREVGTERTIRGALDPGRYALQFFSGGNGGDLFSASLLVVPEPSTGALLMLGLSSLALRRRDR